VAMVVARFTFYIYVSGVGRGLCSEVKALFMGALLSCLKIERKTRITKQVLYRRSKTEAKEKARF
jgi:hypothetical protein